MVVLEKFNVPRCYNSEYLVHVVDQGFFQDTLHEPNQHLYFCLCEESYKNNDRIDSIVNTNRRFEKILNSDVVIEKIDDDYFVLKNRYGFTSNDKVKILAVPV